MEDKILRTEEAQKLAKELNDKYELDKVAEMVKTNIISFSFKDKEYRVRLLNQKEKDELDLFRRRKFGELLQDKNILFESELIRLYKEKGIDIEKEIDDKIKKLLTELNNKRMKLGEALEKKEPESILKTYADEIEELEREIYGLTIQKSNLLENSFEKTLENQVIKYLSYLSLETKVNEEFVRAYTKVEDFLKTEDELIGKTITYSMALNYRI
jgi:hypothetical protein